SPTAAGERAFALRVVDRFGGPVQEFDMELLQVLRNTDGPPHRVRLQAPFARELRPSDFSPDYATIGDIEPGRYAVAVTAAAHGLTLSEPFEITEQGGPFVELRLAQGGELGGRILDPSGQPITGALVRTDSNLQFEGGAQQLFGPMMAARIAGLFTGAETRTDATGHFHFGKLIQNDYALHVEHPDYCPALLRNLPVSDQPLDCRAVLERGAVVHGIASIDGRPTAGLVVQVLAGGDSKKAIESATSGEDGTFRLPGRLRSGSYQIQAHRPDAKVNPFQMLIEIKQSQHAFDIGAKDREVEVDVTIATDKKLQ
ncbi:MAG: carboxypeptidase regulatory-like domain-containing protein, partial [Planctomycetes bacterium]|nr:carboxypeptidase regulatory-like domain-containing protein [Planctomycetota bacterium]